MRFDLAVIGVGPCGLEAVRVAARLGKRVARIVPSVDSPERVETHSRQLAEIETIYGVARFVGPHEILVVGHDGSTRLTAACIVLAVGTRPLRPVHIPFDGCRVLVADELLQRCNRPASLVVVGAGATGLTTAAVLAEDGVAVVLVDRDDRPEPLCDPALPSAVLRRFLLRGIEYRPGCDVVGVEHTPDRIVAHLADGRRMASDAIVLAVGRVGNTGDLDLPAAGIEPDERGRLWCNEHRQTWAEHIYGVGDVIGFPQVLRRPCGAGRQVVEHAFRRTSSAAMRRGNTSQEKPPRGTRNMVPA